MPGAFLNTASPNGISWEAELRGVQPTFDNSGCVAGKWGECMHWAVVFEKQNPEWGTMQQYADVGPAGQVLDYFDECGHGSMRDALEKNEELTNNSLARNDQNFVFQQQAQVVQAEVVSAPVGQPYQQATVAAGQPHHPGAPGTMVVVGVPVSDLAEQRINQGFLPPKANPQTIRNGATILDSNPTFPDRRPCRDVAFAGCFVVVALIMVGIFVWLMPEIPKMVERLSTRYESTIAPQQPRGCGLTPMTEWPNGDPIIEDGIIQRLEQPNVSSSPRLLAEEEVQPGHRCVGCVVVAKAVSDAVPEFELPGLSAYIGRVETFAALVGMKTDLQPHDAGLLHETSGAVGRQLASSRRRRTQTRQQQPDDTNCERACAAFKECIAFDVMKWQDGTTTCKYQKAGQTTAAQASSCWRKIDVDDIDKVAGSIMIRLLGLTVAGAIASMVTAFAFVKFASVQPGPATYCGVYFVPGCMIFLGIVIIASLASILASVAIVMGLVLIGCGSCLCACTWLCYRDLIPLTIEVIKAITDVILKYWSMLFISAGSAIMSIVWSFLCSGVFVGWWARTDRLAATGTATVNVPSQLSYVQYFFECLIYFWGGFVAFNTCHVTFCGVFGRWYYGKNDSRSVSASAKVAFGSSFGSICFGSLIIAVIRAMEAVARKMMNDAEESGNYVTCVIACIISCIISIIGDILEWISLYAYVQVAVRGLGFLPATKATYSMATIGNLIYVVAAILVEWVVGMGAAFCGLTGALFAGVIGYLACDVPEFCVVLAVIGAMFGLLSGCIAGGSAVGVMNSGSVTILMSWAENPQVLQRTHPDLHNRFESVINGKLADMQGMNG